MNFWLRRSNGVKIKTIRLPYEEVMQLPRPLTKKPKKPSIPFRLLMRVASAPDLWKTHFSYDKKAAEKPDGPALILMNHSSFLDLEISTAMLFPKAYCIVCTNDAMIGKSWLMKQLGCMPTQKFVSDLGLIRNIKYVLQELKIPVLMYPEACYSFDGTATTLPSGLGSFLKMLNVPVYMITTYGAYSRDPLYNELQNRKIKVSADMKRILTAEEVAEKSNEELDAAIQTAFSFDAFAWQKENGIRITEPTRADGLHRILYKCPACKAEGRMEGKGIRLSCKACEKTWQLTELGELEAVEGDPIFTHIPDWYAWERSCVRSELEAGEYRLDEQVRIMMMVDHKGIYEVGEGRLTHGPEGFVLDGCEGALHYEQKPLSSYTLNADLFWYEMGDVIGIGNKDTMYYCLPVREGDTACSVAKARLATEELYKICKQAGRRPKGE